MPCLAANVRPTFGGLAPKRAPTSGRPRTVLRKDAPVPKPEVSSNGAPSAEELPPWVRREKERELQAAQTSNKLPWQAGLLGSVLVAIAATGSIYEYQSHNAIFGVLQPDNPLWAPILLVMSVSGYPVAGLLFKAGVDGFNEAAEMQDKLDGYIGNNSDKK